jgi:hypothetical protein
MGRRMGKQVNLLNLNNRIGQTGSLSCDFVLLVLLDGHTCSPFAARLIMHRDRNCFPFFK